MDHIIRSELNENFLKEGEDRGYRPYIDGFKAQKNEGTPGFYMGSIQKRIRDDAGTRYFVNIDMFNMGTLAPMHPGGLSCRACVQFHVDGGDEVADVSKSFDGFSNIEDFFDQVWTNMKFVHYQLD